MKSNLERFQKYLKSESQIFIFKTDFYIFDFLVHFCYLLFFFLILYLYRAWSDMNEVELYTDAWYNHVLTE